MDEVSIALSKINLGSRFLENAEERVTSVFRGEEWKDPSCANNYYWPADKLGETDKEGNRAEKKVLIEFSKPELAAKLKESLFLISGEIYLSNYVKIIFIQFTGREYAFLKKETQQKLTGWVLGESDIIIFTRKLGFICIEVKGIYFPSCFCTAQPFLNKEQVHVCTGVAHKFHGDKRQGFEAFDFQLLFEHYYLN